MKRRQPQVLAALVRYACVLSLLLVSFVHRPAILVPNETVDLAAYALPDGTLPVLCLTGGTEDGKGQVDSKSCEFCRLASSIALPDAPADFQSCALSSELPFNPSGADVFVRQAFSVNSPPRGPPHGNLNT
jgi:hypothetical protein